MDYLMKMVQAGTLCRITYKGKEFVKDKGKDIHRVKIDVDLTDVIPVAQIAPPVPQQSFPPPPVSSQTINAPQPQQPPVVPPAQASEEPPLPF